MGIFAQTFSHTRVIQVADSTPRALSWKPARVNSHRPRLVGVTDGGVETDGAIDEEDVAYPTEQRKRQKAKKEAGHVAKKRNQIVEHDHDDCVEDFGPLGDEYLAESHLDDKSQQQF